MAGGLRGGRRAAGTERANPLPPRSRGPIAAPPNTPMMKWTTFPLPSRSSEELKTQGGPLYLDEGHSISELKVQLIIGGPVLGS